MNHLILQAYSSQFAMASHQAAAVAMFLIVVTMTLLLLACYHYAMAYLRLVIVSHNTAQNGLVRVIQPKQPKFPEYEEIKAADGRHVALYLN